MARIREAEGDLGGALELLDEADACMWVTSPPMCGRQPTFRLH